MQEIINSDTKQIFRDWGRFAMLEEVETYYDPESARMEESILSTTLSVLAGTVQSKPFSSTAAMAHSQQMIFVVQSDEFPLYLNLVTARIVFDEIAFKVEAISHSHVPGTITLECVA